MNKKLYKIILNNGQKDEAYFTTAITNLMAIEKVMNKFQNCKLVQVQILG